MFLVKWPKRIHLQGYETGVLGVACETALAEAGGGIRRQRVGFHICAVSGERWQRPAAGERYLSGHLDHHALTLPANVAICLHPEYQDVLLQVSRKISGGRRIKRRFLENVGLGQAEVVGQFIKATESILNAATPCGPDFLVIPDHVTRIRAPAVCIRPRSRIEDFDVGKQYGLPVLSPVNSGVFGEEGVFSPVNFSSRPTTAC